MEMQRVGMTVGQIYSRTRDHAESLAKKVNCQWTCNLNEIIPDADLYIFSVKDAALPEVISHMKPNPGLWVHTAGSVPMQVFEGYTQRFGVFYPLQTFTKKRRVKLDGTPIFLEVSKPDDMKMLRKIAIALSGNAKEFDSEKRRRIHLAAVFACNFTNHMYTLAARILDGQGIPYDVLLPLITETAERISELPPAEAQTGPAVRLDKEVIARQVALLEEPAMQTIYKLVSQNIYSAKIQE